MPGPVSDNAIADPARCPKTRLRGTDTDKAPIHGSLCRFEHPREPRERELAWLAGRQQRCLHRRQIHAAGLGPKAIRARVRNRVLHPLLSDVYLYGEPRPDVDSRAMAVALHLRGDAVLSWQYAAWLWDLADTRPDRITVTLAGRNARPIPGVILHRVLRLDLKDVRWRKGMPVTAPARTLIDFAAAADPLAVESALARIRYHSLASESQLTDTLARVPTNHPGKPVIRELLNRPPNQLSRTRSRYERKLRRLIQQAELPAPVSNSGVEGIEADLVWPQQRLIVEFDGWEWHKQRVAADKARDAKLTAAGWRVIRITADRVDNHPYAVIAEIAAALSAR